jgi:hypothetical protein
LHIIFSGNIFLVLLNILQKLFVVLRFALIKVRLARIRVFLEHDILVGVEAGPSDEKPEALGVDSSGSAPYAEI